VKILVSNATAFAPRASAACARAHDIAEVTVVAPDATRVGEQLLTLDVPLRCSIRAGRVFRASTPTDCVHLAITGLFDFEHDMVSPRE